MQKPKIPLRVFITPSMLLTMFLFSCGWRQMAIERHEQSMQLRQQEIERRQMELDCLKRKQADPAVDCSQFKSLGGGPPK